MVWYNEIDPAKAAWLRELILVGAIAPGEVDERSIADVRSAELVGFTQCHFFAGIGIWSYALRQAGWPDSRPVWSGSCPCPSFSAAGKGEGFDDPRHLWPEWARLIRECRPRVAFGEQVAAAIGHGWLDLVSTDMETEGYAFAASVLGAHSVGAPHIRQRLYFVAVDGCDGEDGGRAEAHGEPRTRGEVCDLGNATERGLGIDRRAPGKAGHPALASQTGWTNPLKGFWRDGDWIGCRDGKWRPVEPGTFPLVASAAARVVRLRGYGDGICAETAKVFIEEVMEVLKEVNYAHL